MSIAPSVSTILRHHVTLETESIDRVYLNAYVPLLQREAGIAHYFRTQRGARMVSSALMAPISTAFVAAIEQFVAAHHLPLVAFAKGERKEDVAAKFLARCSQREAVLFVGKAQEKITVFRDSAAPKRPDGANISLALPIYGDGQPVLLLSTE